MDKVADILFIVFILIWILSMIYVSKENVKIIKQVPDVVIINNGKECKYWLESRTKLCDNDSMKSKIPEYGKNKYYDR